MATFSERLRELRTQYDYSQQDLADKMGATKQMISQYERGVRKPDLDTLTALCDIFNVSSDYLMGKSDVTVRLLNTEDLKRLNSSQNAPATIAAHFEGDDFTDEEWREIERFKMFITSKRE
jgi:transcriptional regulator with XRE-family HTH domain